MTWPVQYGGKVDLHVKGRISPEDADRQEATAREILGRLESQPGLVLADEVGMGKTFVALAVATMVARVDRASRPVVVMVPPGVHQKWADDFKVFEDRCLAPELKRHLREGVASNAIEFFRFLDDENRTRPHIIFLKHGALHYDLQDPWVKLAILKRAFSSPSLAAEREVFPRYAGDLVRAKSRMNEERFFRELMKTPTRDWRKVMTDWGMDPGDDPVPAVIHDVLRSEKVDLGPLRDALASMPLRGSDSIKERLANTRRAIVAAMRDVWDQALMASDFRSPLLILDEAHHVRNSRTRLASLFVGPEGEEAVRSLEGALANRFERMLFLTATPFQMGHTELLSVLDRFRGIGWGWTRIGTTQAQFQSRIEELRGQLDRMQLASVDLDEKWALLRASDVGSDVMDEAALDLWWQRVRARPQDEAERVQVVLRSYDVASHAMAEANKGLKPWVIRHLRSRKLPRTNENRRRELNGAAIATHDPAERFGLPIRDESILPFLLSARCQTIVTSAGERSRAVGGRITFAEGLASSYEAFRDTRRDKSGAVTDNDDEDVAEGVAAQGATKQRMDWYFKHLDRALQQVGPDASGMSDHPKVKPTVARALDLWWAGEKVLIFCHFRETGRALERHLSTELMQRIRSKAASALGCTQAEVDARLHLLGDRFNPGRPWHRALQQQVESMTSSATHLSPSERDRVFEVLLRFVRTPSFLVRHFDLARDHDSAMLAAAFEREDESGLPLRQKIEAFIRFMDDRTEDERGKYLEALDVISVGNRRARGDEPDDAMRLPNIRLVNGGSGPDERKRIMSAFKTPFFPEVLVASSVMTEGVDLHLECRHVIHHDLCWNPSTLEQRTGRVDRIGAKAEQVLRPIQVYLPYIAGTQDEKMFRVVRDRERWFQVLMGDDYKVDETHTDRLAARIPLPEAAAKDLAMRLEVWG